MKTAVRKKLERARKLRTQEKNDRKRRKIRSPRDAEVPRRKSRDVVRSQPRKLDRDENDVASTAITPVDARALVYSKLVDKIDKDLGLASSLQKQPHISTGLLALDLCLGHGYVPGFNVVFGAEQSAKSTMCVTTLGNSLRANIPVRKYFDAEGAVDRRYAGNILRAKSFDDVFGIRDRQGNWLRPPACRYHDSNIIEEVFRDIKRVASAMPNKVFRPEIGDNGEWFLVFDKSKAETALLKELQLTPDKTLYTKTGKYWCSIGEDDSPQAMFFIDSLPSLIPQAIDEETMSDKGMAITARFLGKYMTLVRGLLRPKGIILIAVNQLRSNPGAQHGPDWYEPAGNAIKFASDTRTMFTSRVPIDGFDKYRFKDNKGLCEEKSVEFEGGTDLYAFKGILNIKNKYGTPGRKAAARVWVKDGRGAPRGFCPVYDVYRVLKELDLIQGPIHDGRRGFRVNIKRIADAEFTWQSFKTLVTAEVYGSKSLLAKAKSMGAPGFKLRDHCLGLIESGKSEELLAAALKRQSSKPVEVDLEDDDE